MSLISRFFTEYLLKRNHPDNADRFSFLPALNSIAKMLFLILSGITPSERLCFCKPSGNGYHIPDEDA